MESLTLCNLSIGYGRHVVGAQLSARVAAGGVTLLLGRNGCGKSTLLHCLGGLLPPLAGEVWWDGSARMYAPRTCPPRGFPTDHTARRSKPDGTRCARNGPLASPRCDYAVCRPTCHAARGATLRRGRLVVASAPHAERRTGTVGDAGADFGARHPAAFARRTHRALGFAREARALCPAAELGTGGRAHDHCFDARLASHLS